MIRWMLDMWRRRKTEAHREWAHVPPPEWAAKRGTGRDYW
jgi:hypothetical protein